MMSQINKQDLSSLLKSVVGDIISPTDFAHDLFCQSLVDEDCVEEVIRIIYGKEFFRESEIVKDRLTTERLGDAINLYSSRVISVASTIGDEVCLLFVEEAINDIQDFGWVYTENGNSTVAKSLFFDSVKLANDLFSINPEKFAGVYGLALYAQGEFCFKHIDDLETANEAYRKSYEVFLKKGTESGTMSALRSLGCVARLLLYEGNFEEAEEQARKAVAGFDDDFCISVLGTSLICQGKYEEAEKVLSPFFDHNESEPLSILEDIIADAVIPIEHIEELERVKGIIEG